jgi:hypothetical protein
MTSNINTNGINVNYPVPGQNNSSQGFRDNFAQIKTQIDTGATEITDLQSKVILKAALNNSTLNNDMGNTQISNLSTRGFRATTYNLGNSLAGTVLVDVNRADVQYGSLTGNVTLQFGNWAPTNTESNVVVRFNVANANAVISFPSSVISSNNNYGVTLLENYATIANVATVTAPANATILEYRFSTLDCGNTVTVEPVNRPFQATQIKDGTPSPVGFPGDTPGTVLTDSSYIYVCTANFAGTVNSTKTVANTFASGNIITLNSTSGMTVADPIIFTGNVYGGLVANSVYYIKTISSPNITVSTTGFDGVVGNAFALTTANGAGVSATSYNGTSIWKRIDLAGTTGNDIVTGNLQVNYAANIGTTLTVGGNITTTGIIGIGTSTPDAELNLLATPQTVSYPVTGNSTTLGTDLHISGADGSNTRITQDAFGTGSYVAFTGRSSRGTAASPTQSQSGDTLTQFTARGFSNGTLQFGNVSTGRVDFIAAENFTDTSRATNVAIYTTSTGNIAPTAIATFTGTGANIAGTATITGNTLVTGTGGLGYGTGSGGAITQSISRTTGVTLNKTNGAITLFTAAGSATATTFTVTNSTVAATDVVQVSVKSATNTYLAFVSAVAASSFNITFYTTGGTASDAPVFNFAVIKAVVA